ncbi:uncharacterized protein VTP21DRAFT_7581 [Calcarisporiella thermophila]|uniref:uncharacterized protein n=1 Tax=Calcarisporiella thermophila TaxID=911321 RepID=UPI0037442EB7
MTGPNQNEIAQNDNLVIIVFGASGDLARKKTYPALFSLHKHKFFPSNTKIIGYARTPMDAAEYNRRITSSIKNPEPGEVDAFLNLTSYVSGQYDEDASFEKLVGEIEKAEKEMGAKIKLVAYLALPPSVFTAVARMLKKHVHPRWKNGFRVVVEKPFGHDLESFRDLQREFGELFTEEEVYRIDHYLGKEMVKNLLTLRFANVIFGAVWNRQYIENVQITLREPFGTEGRGGYFDEFGIIRDVMQNHLLQILSIVAMEPPVSLSSQDIRDEKVKVLRCIPPIKPSETIVGQYTASADGSKPAYKDDKTVPPNSNCPTFAANVLWINNDRWQGVPFILKAGKALHEQKVEVRVLFRNVANGQVYPDAARNELIVRVQPNEAVQLRVTNKVPGFSIRSTPTTLDLTYKDRFQGASYRIPDAYEALILDVLRGDQSHFVRDDELDAAWRIFTPMLHALEKGGVVPLPYAYGSPGPAEVAKFLERHGVRDEEEIGAGLKSAKI